MRIRLGDADRQRLGCPEWLVEDLDIFSIVDAELLQRGGVDPDEAIVEISGEEIDGDRRRVSMRGWRIRVWLALRRVGITVSFADFDFNVIEWRKEPVAAEGEPEEGKGESESPSGGSVSSTTP